MKIMNDYRPKMYKDNELNNNQENKFLQSKHGNFSSKENTKRKRDHSAPVPSKPLNDSIKKQQQFNNNLKSQSNNRLDHSAPEFYDKKTGVCLCASDG